MTTERILADLVAGRTVVEEVAQTTPAPVTLGGATGDMPRALDDLTTQVSRTYDLSVTAAAQASIPVVGSVSGGFNRRVIVLERTAYKEMPSSTGNDWYGYAIRLGITANKVDSSTKLTLPFLAASAEVGAIEAKWVLQVVGLSGPKIDEVAIPPTELNVETFVLAKQSLTSLIGAVRDPGTHFSAEIVGSSKTLDELDRQYHRAVAWTYALGRLERGRKLQDALSDMSFGREEIRDLVTDFYHDFAGITNPQDQPTPAVRSKAATLLGGVKAEPR